MADDAASLDKLALEIQKRQRDRPPGKRLAGLRSDIQELAPEGQRQALENLVLGGADAQAADRGGLQRRRLKIAVGFGVAIVIAFGIARHYLESSERERMTRARRSDVGSAPYRRNTPSAARVIVFLHGLFGDSQDTWTCSTASPPAYWPDLLRGDAIFDDADIYAAAYDSPYYGNTMALYQVAENLNIRLVADAVFSRHKEVVFVVHSLGGLVIQQLLLTYREYAAQVPFIYFYSTPDTGAQLARLGAHFSADPILKQLIPGNQNIYLANMESEWQHAGFGAIRRHCVYETLSTGGFVVVDRLSGTRSCDASVPINEDHISIVKPCDRRADSYLALLNAYSALKARGNTER